MKVHKGQSQPGLAGSHFILFLIQPVSATWSENQPVFVCNARLQAVLCQHAVVICASFSLSFNLALVLKIATPQIVLSTELSLHSACLPLI